MSGLHDLIILTIQVVHVRYDHCEVCPELNAVVAHLLNLFGHLREKSLEFFDIGKLLIGIFLLGGFCLNIGIDHVLISEDSKLLI